MFWYTHVLMGVAAASFFFSDASLLLLAGLFAALPDLDKPFGHRQWFSHSILSAFVLGISAFVASGSSVVIGFVVFLAIFSHAVVDIFSKSGVPLLYPLFKENIKIRLFTAYNRTANKLFILSACLILAFNFAG